MHNRTRLTNFDPGSKVGKVCFGFMWVYVIFLKKDLKESMIVKPKKELPSPEVPLKRNKFLKYVINFELFRPF